MPVSLSEATETLLSGQALAWPKFGDQKAGAVQLASPAARRLFHYLLASDAAKVAEAKEELFDGLIAAWQNTSFDPASATKNGSGPVTGGSWRLIRMEASGFGGLNAVDGPDFVLPLNGENWCLEGQNGSGKTSIASAIIWAMTGWRCRDQDGVIRDDGQRVAVFSDSGTRIGDWPPIVAYPTNPAHLGNAAQTWVRLTFQNENGDTAEAFRKLTTPPAGQPAFESKIDQSLLGTLQLIETGLLMPARLARIGFGDHSHSIYEAVKLLTGLDQLSDIGEGAANFVHKAKRFLKYAADNGIQAIETKINLQLKRAEEEASKAAFVLAIKHKREEREYAGELRDVAQDASAKAGDHLSTLTSDVHSELDTANSADRVKIKNAVSTARGLLQQGVKDIPVFQAWNALKIAQADEKFQSLPQALATATKRLEEAIGWDKRQAEDAKLRLKALASIFYTPSDHGHSGSDCPLCESKLSGEKQKALAAELAELKVAAAIAERKLPDACAEIEKKLRDLLPQGLQAQFDLLAGMQPCDGFREAAFDCFAIEPPFSNVLVGIAQFTEATVNAQIEKLPKFAAPASLAQGDVPEVAQALYIYMHKIERIAALAAWWEPNRAQFVEAWTALKGVASADGSFPPDTLEGKLATLEAALEKAAPLDELAKALKEVADAADKWLPIYAHQLIREQIAKHLEPLKDLRVLVATQTSSTISTLSSRIKTILDRIHFKERLIFEDAALSNKTVQVTGSFAHGIRIDAATVANSSWLRAILWAFVLALREHTLEGLGSNPFPLMVLDDPQATFDPRNKRKWAEELRGMQMQTFQARAQCSSLSLRMSGSSSRCSAI